MAEQTLPPGAPNKGAVADHAAAELVVGCKLPSELFELKLWGRRVIVVREPAEVKVGSIIIPERHQSAKSAGWVISCGPEVGTFTPGCDWAPFYPKDLLLKKVFFGRYAGTALPVVRATDEGIEVPRLSDECDYIVMMDMDILANF